MIQWYLEEEEDVDLVTTLKMLSIENKSGVTLEDDGNDNNDDDDDDDDDSTTCSNTRMATTTKHSIATKNNYLWFPFIEQIKCMPE